MNVSLKIHPLLLAGIIIGILLLVFLLLKGCHQSKLEVAAREKTQHIADSALTVLKDYKSAADSAAKDFQDTLELATGQLALAKEQNVRLGGELQDALADNKKLIEKHKLAEYTDTTATVVPKEYLTDCEDCFVKLENTTNKANRFQSDLNNLQDKWDKQNQIYLKRFKELDAEKLGFYNKINVLAKEAKDASDKLKPHGRLYLSWGVMWSPWPVAAGAGFMYQNKYNMMYGLKWYYGNQGHMIETSMHFPLSIKF